MRFRNLKDGDWTFGAGKNNYLARKDALKANIRTRVLSWERDCFFAQDENVDWVNGLGRKGQFTNLEQQIRRTILNTPDVSGLVSFSFNLENRRLTVQYEVTTAYSESVQDTIERSL